MSELQVESLYVPTAPGQAVDVRCPKCGAVVPVLTAKGVRFNCKCRIGEGGRRKTYEVVSVLPLKIEEVEA